MVLRTPAFMRMLTPMLALTLVGTGCVVLEDRCVDVRCGEGEICLDLEEAPVCVCDVEHTTDDSGACAPVQPPDDADAGPVDGG